MAKIVKRVLVYLRVSTKGQARKENPLETQKSACLAFAEKNGYEVADIYIDGGISGRTDERDAFKKMTKRLEEDDTIEGVIAYDMSRIFRNGIEYFNYKKHLKKYDKKLFSTVEQINDDGTPTEFMAEWTLAGINQYRSMEDGRKIKNGMLEKAQNGVLPGKAPFGFKNIQEKVSSSKSKRWIEVEEDEANWVRRVFQLFTTSKYSVLKLAEALSNEGFPMRNSKKLRQGFFHYMLTNPVYIGKIPYKNEVYNGKHPALIDEATFQKAQDILFEHGNGADRSPKHHFPLKVILYCAKCGAKYTGEEHKIKNGSIIRYLRCRKTIRGERVECGERYFQEDHIANQFENIFKQIQLPNSFTEKLRERIKKLFSDEQDIYEKSRKSVLNRLDAIKKQKKNLVLNFINKARTEQDEELYESVKNELEIEEAKLTNQLNEVEGNLSQALKVLEIALVLSNNCYRAYKKANPDLQGLLAKAFFEKVAVSNGEIVSVKLNKPLDFLIKNRVRHNSLFELDNTGGLY